MLLRTGGVLDVPWFTYFRQYGPTQEFFDKTWTLPDIDEAIV